MGFFFHAKPQCAAHGVRACQVLLMLDWGKEKEDTAATVRAGDVEVITPNIRGSSLPCSP